MKFETPVEYKEHLDIRFSKPQTALEAEIPCHIREVCIENNHIRLNNTKRDSL